MGVPAHLQHSCTVADFVCLRPSCLTHYLSWFYFDCCPHWLTDHRGLPASSGSSYCMTSSWVFLLQQTGEQLPRPYRSPLCIWVGDKEEGLSKVRGEKTPSGSDYVSDGRLRYILSDSYVFCHFFSPHNYSCAKETAWDCYCLPKNRLKEVASKLHFFCISCIFSNKVREELTLNRIYNTHTHTKITIGCIKWIFPQISRDRCDSWDKHI